MSSIKNNKSVGIILLASLLSVVLVAGCIAQETENKNKLTEFQIEYAGSIYNFRANLTEAMKVPVYPNETEVLRIFANKDIDTIRIVYQPNETEDPFYSVAAFELAYKLTKINQQLYGKTIPIETVKVSENEKVLADYYAPIIGFLGPSLAESTSVEVEGYFIRISGKDFSEINRKYTDLDLAVDKFLLVLMGKTPPQYGPFEGN